MKLHAIAVIAGAVLLSACQTGRNDATRTKSVSAGGTIVLNSIYNIRPDCASAGPIDVTVMEQPRRGRVNIVNTTDFPSFRESNIRSGCNKHKVPVVKTTYSAERGYAGSDYVSLRVIFSDGDEWIRRYNINVR